MTSRPVDSRAIIERALLYTVEVWHAGFTMPPHRQLVYVLLALVLLLGYNRYAGLHPDSTWAEVAIDSIEEIGIGLLLSAVVLLLLGRITPGQDVSEVVGRIVVEAVTVAIGVGPTAVAGQCVALGVASTIGASAGRLLLQGADGE